MAYLIKSLGIRYKGDMIEISSNKKEYILELINKMPNEIINDKKESHNEVLNNDNDYKINISIPEKGNWKLKILYKNPGNSYFFDLKISVK